MSDDTERFSAAAGPVICLIGSFQLYGTQTFARIVPVAIAMTGFAPEHESEPSPNDAGAFLDYMVWVSATSLLVAPLLQKQLLVQYPAMGCLSEIRGVTTASHLRAFFAERGIELERELEFTSHARELRGEMEGLVVNATFRETCKRLIQESRTQMLELA